MLARYPAAIGPIISPSDLVKLMTIKDFFIIENRNSSRNVCKPCAYLLYLSIHLYITGSSLIQVGGN